MNDRPRQFDAGAFVGGAICIGLGVLSIHTLEVELMLKRLVVLDVEGFPIMRHWYIVHRQGKRFSAIAQAFKEFMLNEAPALLKVPTADAATQNSLP